MRISIGGGEAAGFFKEATGFDSEAAVVEAKATHSASATHDSSGTRPADAGLDIAGEVTDAGQKSWLAILSHPSFVR